MFGILPPAIRWIEPFNKAKSGLEANRLVLRSHGLELPRP